jgi:hypothetical protein
MVPRQSIIQTLDEVFDDYKLTYSTIKDSRLLINDFDEPYLIFWRPEYQNFEDLYGFANLMKNIKGKGKEYKHCFRYFLNYFLLKGNLGRDKSHSRKSRHSRFSRIPMLNIGSENLMFKECYQENVFCEKISDLPKIGELYNVGEGNELSLLCRMEAIKPFIVRTEPKRNVNKERYKDFQEADVVNEKTCHIYACHYLNDSLRNSGGRMMKKKYIFCHEPRVWIEEDNSGELYFEPKYFSS